MNTPSRFVPHDPLADVGLDARNDLGCFLFIRSGRTERTVSYLCKLTPREYARASCPVCNIRHSKLSRISRVVCTGEMIACEQALIFVVVIVWHERRSRELRVADS